MEANEVKEEGRKFRRSLLYTLSFTTILWLVKGLEEWGTGDLGHLGILPRTLYGTFGIFTAPLIHGDLAHLLSNTFPLILLGIGVFYFYDKIAVEVFWWIYLTTGFWVWLAARGDAYHIGASGVIYGLVGFLFFSGIFRKDSRGLAVSLAVLFLYGGMIMGLSPHNPEVSYESHILGMVAGAFCAFHFRKSGRPKIAESTVTEDVSEEFKPLNMSYSVTFKEKTQQPEKYEYTISKSNSSTSYTITSGTTHEP